jgi:hypothetical protein
LNPGFTKQFCDVCHQTSWDAQYYCNTCNGTCSP